MPIAVIGVAGATGRESPRRRLACLGSWIGQPHQGPQMAANTASRVIPTGPAGPLGLRSSGEDGTSATRRSGLVPEPAGSRSCLRRRLPAATATGRQALLCLGIRGTMRLGTRRHGGRQAIPPEASWRFPSSCSRDPYAFYADHPDAFELQPSYVLTRDESGGPVASGRGDGASGWASLDGDTGGSGPRDGFEASGRGGGMALFLVVVVGASVVAAAMRAAWTPE